MKRNTAVLYLFLIALSGIWASSGIANPGIIPVMKFTTPAMPGGVPDGWKLDRKSGRPLMSMEKDGDSFYLRLISPGNSAFGVRKEARVDVKRFPILCWRWKAAKLPRDGDVRKSGTDDQAIQVYVAFKESGLLGLNTPVIGYIWDNDAPKGWHGRSSQTGGGKLRYIVLRNKTDNVGQWYTERRNVYQDYKRLFADINGGEPQGATTGMQIYINSQHTKSPAESMIGDIYFSSEPSGVALAPSGTSTIPERERVARISAVRPAAIAKKKPKKIFALPDCFYAGIEFDTDSTIVEDRYKDTMRKAADYLKEHDDAVLNIVGHTDNVGNEEYNVGLSRRRAQSVSNYLVEQLGIDPQHLIVEGAGFADPIAANDTPEGRRQNRNVVISGCPEQ